MSNRRVALQDRGLETQQKVLEAAAEMFRRFGYQGASIRSISDAAGMSVGAINFHFRTKEQIARAILEEQRARMAAVVAEFASQYDAGITRLVHVSYGITRLLMVDQVVQAGVELATEVGDFVEVGSSPYDDWLAALAAEFSQALGQGEIASECDAATLAETYLASFVGVQMLSRMRSERRDLVGQVLALWLTAISALVPLEAQAQLRALVREVFVSPGISAAPHGERSVRDAGARAGRRGSILG